MKELSMEEKAKAYDEAIKKIQEIIIMDNVPVTPKEIGEYLFPKLKELEDEKIRKELLESFKYQQRESRTDKEWLNGIKLSEVVAWLEKQGEQNPADKVEPKFKVGDWIVQKYLGKYLGTYKIIEVCESWYEVISYSDGIQYSIGFDKEDDCHLWSIKDAKDGDVLFHSDSASNGIFIFKELLKYKFSEKVICYCDYDSEDHFCLGEHHTCCWADAKILHPATKEQRDLLFQKMKEAGYEWDVDKKELNEIHNALEECEIENIEHGKYYYCIKDYFCGGKKQASKGDVVQALRGMSIMGLGVKANEYFLPVNSIKQKSAWSEEDEYTLYETIKHLEELIIIDKSKHCGVDVQYYQRDIDWLKSLKDRVQSQWKPSDEQLDALHDAAVYVDKSMFPHPKGILMKMYKQLKKLRKE